MSTIRGKPPSVELIERAQAGDEPAFEALYRARVDEVFHYAKSIVRNTTVAEDVTAQTFLQAWKALPRLREPERFDGWPFRIAHNVALNEVRGDGRSVALEGTPEPVQRSRFNDPEALLELQFDIGAVRAGLLDLPENLRDVLVLRFVVGLSHEEVGRQIDKTPQNARVMQFRALKRLRNALECAGFTAAG